MPLRSDRINFTAPRDVAEMLRQTGNASAYIVAIVQRRWREWQNSFAHLVGAGWYGNEIEAACDLLSGYYFSSIRPPREPLAIELRNGVRVNEVLTETGVDRACWRERIEALACDDDIAQALWTVAQEFSAGNMVLKERIKKLGASAVKPVDA